MSTIAGITQAFSRLKPRLGYLPVNRQGTASLQRLLSRAATEPLQEREARLGARESLRAGLPARDAIGAQAARAAR